MRLSGFHLPVESLRASALTMAVQCPEKFRRHYILNEHSTGSVDTFLGTVDHETIAENFRVKMRMGVDMGESTLLSTYRTLWHESVEKEVPSWGNEEPEELYDRGVEMVKLYHQEVAPTVVPIAVEEEFRERIPGVPVEIVGHPDVLTQERIVERKTTGQKVSKPKPTWLLQGRIYQLAINKPVEWQVTTKQKTPQVVFNLPSLMLMASNKDHTVLLINQIVERLDDIYVRYGANHPWPTDGILHDWMCGYCQFGPRYQNDCVAWSKGVLSGH